MASDNLTGKQKKLSCNHKVSIQEDGRKFPDRNAVAYCEEKLLPASWQRTLMSLGQRSGSGFGVWGESGSSPQRDDDWEAQEEGAGHTKCLSPLSLQLYSA